MTASVHIQNSPERGGALVNGGGAGSASPATTTLPPDFHAAMLRVLIALDEMAAAFMRLDADARAMVRAGFSEAVEEDDVDA